MPKAMLDSYRVWIKVSIISYFVVFLQKQNLGIVEISMRKTWYAWSVILSSSRTLRSSRPRSVQFIVDWDIEINRWPTLFLLNRTKWGQNVWKIGYDEGTPVWSIRQNTGHKARDESEGKKVFFLLQSMIWGIAFINVNVIKACFCGDDIPKNSFGTGGYILLLYFEIEIIKAYSFYLMNTQSNRWDADIIEPGIFRSPWLVSVEVLGLAALVSSSHPAWE